MYTIKNNISNTIIIKNSKFICCLYKINNENEAKQYIEESKSLYKDATHYCYAYIIDEKKKFSDDNEPGGTAGSPMLQVLEKNNLNLILCIVVRYFGGIKLGAGGLVRAYSKSVSKCLEKSDLYELIKGYNVDIIFNYDKVKIIDNMLNDRYILNKEFDEKIKYNVNISKEDYENIKKIADITIIKDIYV